MSALAHMLLDQECEVFGSDSQSNHFTDQLKDKGAVITVDQSKLPDLTEDMTIVYSSSIRKNHPQLVQAKEKNLPLMHRSDLLSYLSEAHDSIAIAGTHGKTTTTSFLTHLFKECDQDPMYIIGGLYDGLNGYYGSGKHFIFEADESDRSFLKYHPLAAVILNVDLDHMENYGTEKNIIDAFAQFSSQVTSEKLVYCGDDSRIQSLKLSGISYGFNSDCDAQILSFKQIKNQSFFQILFEKNTYYIESPMLGKHNAYNATAAFVMARSFGLDAQKIIGALKTFKGVSRRLEKKFSYQQIQVFDDYAHHPVEVKASIEALKTAYPEHELIVCFQPHRYSRLSFHFESFTKAFSYADTVWMTDVYHCGEKSHGHDVLDLVNAMKSKLLPVEYVPREKIAQALAKKLKPHHILLILGAGDSTDIAYELKKQWEETPCKKWKIGVVFGGMSPEHEISLKSADFVLKNLDPSIYEVVPFLITRKGEWICGEPHDIDTEKELPQSFFDPKIFKIFETIDFCFPVLHGPFGEDGQIQGFCEILHKPYAGSSTIAAAVSNDKVISKHLARSFGIQTPKFVHFTYEEWRLHQKKCLDAVKELHFPVYVKPTKMGSSIGIYKISSFKELPEGVNKAFQYDAHILVEEGISQFKECSFALLGNSSTGIDVTTPGEVFTENQMYDFEKKYGEHPSKTTLYPKIPYYVIEEGKHLAKKLCEGIHNTGYMRIDFLLDQKNQWWFIEMNAIPGMQERSLFPKLWHKKGLNARQLMDKMIILGLHKFRERKHFA